MKLKKIFNLLLLLLAFQQVNGYPIPPQSLRILITQSPIIVIAIVDNPSTSYKTYNTILKDSVENYTFGDGLANLKIIEVLKGDLGNLTQISVSYNPGMICPAPARYPDKKTVIAFLSKNETGKTYNTVGLSYGSKILESDKDLEIYKKRINEYFEIQKIINETESQITTVEWLVKCLENRCTRWDGVFDLTKNSFGNFYAISNISDSIANELTPSQIKRIDSVFYAENPIGDNELGLLEFMIINDYKKLKDHLLQSLPKVDYYTAKDIMREILNISTNKELYKIYSKFSKIDYYDKDKEVKQQNLLADFLIEIKKIEE